MQNKRLAVCLVCVAFGIPLFAQDLELTGAEQQVWGLSQSLLSRMWPTANEEGALSLMHEDVVFWTPSQIAFRLQSAWDCAVSDMVATARFPIGKQALDALQYAF